MTVPASSDPDSPDGGASPGECPTAELEEEGPAGLRFRISPAPAEAGARLDRVLARHLAGTEAAPSRERVKALIAAGAITAETAPGAPPGTPPGAGGATIGEPSYRVKPGESYLLLLPPAEAALPAAQDIPLAVLFEDAHLIVVDKPAGLVVHPAPGNPDSTLVNALLRHCGDSLSGINGVRRPGIVHRLDKETSGVMVAAKTDAAHRGLAALFESHDLEREYLALAWGRPMPPAGRIEAPIGRDPNLRTRMAVRGGAGSRYAATDYRLLRSFDEGADGVPLASLLACRLQTGRTHQIRVHLAHIGHPVVGDPVYGRTRRPKRPHGKGSKGKGAGENGAGAASLLAAFPRQALHAAVLGFRHPVTGEEMRFETPPPADFAALLAALEA
ncbi:RluA family pseudouridine synthase [Marinibaculum pumilum]|uniref:Pseudouridine synthase n=1 Tax=Marinibaculum pumilum TaxID=1766165 RepID=A0ABV7KXM2_9PROT